MILLQKEQFYFIHAYEALRNSPTDKLLNSK